MSREIKLDEVTVVTGNNRVALVEAIGFFAFLYYINHPDVVDDLKDTVLDYWDRLTHRLSVWQARGAIHSLPETDVNEQASSPPRY